jgi:signal transduction histidine kinase
LQRIMGTSKRLDALVQDILAYSRVSRVEIVTQPIDLDLLLREILDQYPNLKAPQAVVDVKKPLGRVKGHDASLTQCISNLLGNAVKFVAQGVKPQVEVGSEQSNGHVRLWVKDNGIGIDPAYQKRIFKMFERAPHDRSYDGTGIGLAIVRKAIERMGGEFGLVSSPGEGSTFWIQLPKAES